MSSTTHTVTVSPERLNAMALDAMREKARLTEENRKLRERVFELEEALLEATGGDDE
jgi:hypothetical protein